MQAVSATPAEITRNVSESTRITHEKGSESLLG
ncbi:hypothetical protein FHS20_004549 [Phyllobacterium endophyticum]|nr:hypothetical protein [Phyllobacterium endophyticum]